MKNVLLTLESQIGMPVLNLDRVKQFLRITTTTDDEMLMDLVQMATKSAENIMSKTLTQKLYKYSFIGDAFTENNITLPMPPVLSVLDVKIDSSTVDFIQIGDTIIISSALTMNKSIDILYTAGFIDSTHVPHDIVLAILLHVYTIYKDRGSFASIPKPSMDVYNSNKMLNQLMRF